MTSTLTLLSFSTITYTAKNTLISPDFLVWKFPQNFQTRKSGEITVFFVVLTNAINNLVTNQHLFFLKITHFVTILLDLPVFNVTNYIWDKHINTVKLFLTLIKETQFIYCIASSILKICIYYHQSFTFQLLFWTNSVVEF